MFGYKFASSGWLIAVAGVVAAWLLLPTAPNYDTASHLVWAGELLHGSAPDVSALAGPTPHPLWLLLAMPAQVTGHGAAVMQLVSIAALFVSVACSYRLAAQLAGPLAGAVAALFVGSSFALLINAFKAYVDLPFVALVLAALVLEQQHQQQQQQQQQQRAGRHAMPLLMFAAGLLRPEAWAYGLLLIALRVWRAPGAADRRQAGIGAAIVLAAPVLWVVTDLLLTGDAFHSLTGTQALAEELGRKTGLAAAPTQLLVQLGDLARPPVAAAGLLGVLLTPRIAGLSAARLPLAMLAAGCLGFLLVGALGLPLLQRYLLIPAVLACVFAGVAAAAVVAAAFGRPLPSASAPRTSTQTGRISPLLGISSPGAGPSGGPAVRVVGVLALAAAVLGGGAYLTLKAGSFRVLADGVLQEARWQRQAADLLARPTVKAQRCGPVTMPTYRFVPELTLAAGLREGDVVSRATELGGAGPQQRGLAVVIDGDRHALRRLGWAAAVPRTTNTLPPGFTVIAHDPPFVVASRCK